MATNQQPLSSISIGLDMGSSKTSAVIIRTNNNQPEIIGTASLPSRGIRKGVIVNLEQAALVTTAVIEQAELQAGTTVDSVILGISGGHIESTKSRGIIAIQREISSDDVHRVIEAATSIVIPPDREIIHVLPQSFSVDDEQDIKDPVGMVGSRLEVYVHIITVAASSVNNLIKSVYKAGFDTADIILKPLAAAKALIKEQEKEEGCILIDIGASTTNFVIFTDGGIKHSGQLSIGGSHITSDISYGMKTTMHIAEQIKCAYGVAIAESVSMHDQIEIPTPNGRTERIESRRLLCEIIQPRLEEILFLLNEEIEKTGLRSYLSSGVVLTGGVSNTYYIEDLATEIFNLPVRIGLPVSFRGLDESIKNPSFSTATGLALYGIQQVAPKLGNITSPDEEKNFQKIVYRIQDWFNEFF